MPVKIKVYYDKDQLFRCGTDLYNAVDQIKSIVQRASENAYNQSALQDSVPKLKNWNDAIKAYFDSISKRQTYDTSKMPMLYGYAVEELSNRELKAPQNTVMFGYNVRLQVCHGSTIPDIVLIKGTEEKAWLDITSENSEGHILRKSGSGWHLKSFVAELLYAPLNLTNIRRTEECSIGSRIHALSVDRQRAIYQDNLNKYFQSKFTDVLTLMQKTLPLNKPTIANIIEYVFRYSFSPSEKHAPIKSMLQLFSNSNYNLINVNYAKEILKNFYNSDSQNLAKAYQFIEGSFQSNSQTLGFIF